MNGLVAPYGHYSERMFAVDGGLISYGLPDTQRTRSPSPITSGGESG
jgi:hypothetical protein